MRMLAIGDIHGVSTALDALWKAVAPMPEDTVVFLGDYVDRGPDSKGVIERILAWSKTHRLVCLRGNHEVMMVRARDGGDSLKEWFSNGGRAAVDSYGGFNAIPDEHWRFLEEELKDYHETDSHICVHANLWPELELDEQPELMLFWEHLTGPIRHDSGKRVICGHTSQRSGEIKAWPETVCIDTYCYGGGWLTCLDVGTDKYWQADVMGRVRTGHLNV